MKARDLQVHLKKKQTSFRKKEVPEWMIEVDWKLNLSPKSFILFLQTQCFFTGLVTEPRLLQKTLFPDMLRINKNYLSLRRQ